MSWMRRRYTQRRVVVQKEATPPPETLEGGDMVCVPFIPLRCPACQSKKVKAYGHGRGRGKVRYHLCECGFRFKSVEVDLPT